METYSIDSLTYGEIGSRFAQRASLIVPLGGTVPYGEHGVLGVETICATAIASELASRLGVLFAPAIPFTCSIPFMSFPGCAGIHPRTFTNVVGDLCNCFSHQGVRRILFIDMGSDNIDSMEHAVERLTNSANKASVRYFSFHHDSRVRAAIAKRAEGVEALRSEFGMLSLMGHLDPAGIRSSASVNEREVIDQFEFNRWRKRGKDPDKLRKLAPTASTSSLKRGYDPDFGKELFAFVVGLLEEDHGFFLSGSAEGS